MDAVTLSVALSVAAIAAVTAIMFLRRDLRELRGERSALRAEEQSNRHRMARMREQLGTRYTAKDHADRSATAVAQGQEADLQIETTVTTEQALGADIDRAVPQLVSTGELVGAPEDPASLAVAPHVPPARAAVLTILVDSLRRREDALGTDGRLTGGAATARAALEDANVRFMPTATSRAGGISNDFRGRFAMDTMPGRIKSAVERAERALGGEFVRSGRKDLAEKGRTKKKGRAE